MKKIKKLFALSLGITLLVPNLIYAKSFKDLNKNGQYKWAYEAVDSLSNKNILSGYEDGSFKPQKPVSFLEVLQIIKNIKNPSSDMLKISLEKFEDLAKGYSVPDWAMEAVCYNLNINTITENTLKAAKDGGFLNVKSPTFPDRNSVTVYFARAFSIEQSKDIGNLKHKDLDKIPELVKPYLSTFVKLNIYSDTGSDGYFNGKKYIRRSEFALVANNILKNIYNDNIENNSIKTGQEDLKTESLLPNGVSEENIDKQTSNLSRARILNLTINGKNSSIFIDKKTYSYDSENLLLDGKKINPAYLSGLIGHEYTIKLDDEKVVELISLPDSEVNRQDGEDIEMTVRVMSTNQDEMIVSVMISNNLKYRSGMDIRLKARQSFAEGALLKVKAKLINDHLEDLKIEKI